MAEQGTGNRARWAVVVAAAAVLLVCVGVAVTVTMLLTRRSGRAPQPQPAAPPSEVVYNAYTHFGGAVLRVDYLTPDGAEMTDTVPDGWGKSFPEWPGLYSISVTNLSGGAVSCEIVRNGSVISKQTDTGSVTCSAS